MHRTPEARERLDTIMDRLATLLERSRQESQSVLVPMGEEMQYDSQDNFIGDLRYALRALRDRFGQ